MFNVKKIYLAFVTYLVPLRKSNWKVILLCFSTAATFWFFNALNKEYTTRINYPVSLVFDRDSLVALKYPPDAIPINVTGGGWQLLKRTISGSAEPVIIEPENPVQTQFFTSNNLLPIFSSQLTDININYIATDTIFFKIDPYADKRLGIKLDSASIQLREDHFITSKIVVEPDSVNFHGPLSMINQLPDVFVVSLSEKNINNQYDEELSLDLFSPTLIKKYPEVIHIKFDVEEFVEQNLTLNLELVNFPYDSTVYINTTEINVSFRVQKSFRNQSTKDNFLIIADLNDIQTADSTITIEIMDSPEFIKDLSIKESRLQVIYAQ